MAAPGDYILDKYMPNATREEREAARENLYAFAAVVVRICERVALERQGAIRVKRTTDVDSENISSNTV